MASLMFLVVLTDITFSEFTSIVNLQQLLPRADAYMAAGWYNDSIYIIGGHQTPQQITQYNIKNNIFIDIGAKALSDSTFGYGQFYTQQHNNLFMISAMNSEHYISLYHLDTNQFESRYKGLNITSKPGYYGCLTSTPQYLIIFGETGDNNYNGTVEVLHLTDYKWLNDVQTTQEPRWKSACIVDESTDTIYVIGGQSSGWWSHDTEAINTIEINNMDTIQQTAWSYIPLLTVAVSSARCVIYNNWIFVIGGSNGIDKAYNMVQLIDTETQTTSIAPYTLPWDVSGAATVLSQDVIYVFGGLNRGNIDNGLNVWMYNALTTVNPTMNPDVLSEPTVQPTSDVNKSTVRPESVCTTSDGEKRKYLVIGICVGIVIAGVLGIFVVVLLRRKREFRKQESQSFSLNAQLLESSDEKKEPNTTSLERL